MGINVHCLDCSGTYMVVLLLETSLDCSGTYMVVLLLETDVSNSKTTIYVPEQTVYVYPLNVLTSMSMTSIGVLFTMFR